MANVWNGLSGGLGGAGTGALIGSAVPGIGTAIGAGVGGGLGLLGGLFGSQGQQGGVRQANRFTSQQQNLQNSAIDKILSMISNPQSRYEGFQPIEDLARKNFQEKTIPSLAERFTSMGGQKSSAFTQQLGQAGSGLESQLGALRSQYGLQNQGLQNQQLNQLFGFGMQPSYENYYMESQPGLGEGSLNNILQLLPDLLKALQQNKLGGQ